MILAGTRVGLSGKHLSSKFCLSIQLASYMLLGPRKSCPSICAGTEQFRARITLGVNIKFQLSLVVSYACCIAHIRTFQLRVDGGLPNSYAKFPEIPEDARKKRLSWRLRKS